VAGDHALNKDRIPNPRITDIPICRSYAMAEKLDSSELVSFKELLMANSMQVDAIAQLLIEKGVFTKKEFFDMLKKVQMEYQNKKGV